jgi:flagellar biosynthesis protein FliQ
MQMADVRGLFQGAMKEVLIVAGPILVVAIAVGLVIAILQATTSIQEQSVTFVAKIAAILLGLIVFGRLLIGSLIEYTKHIFQSITNM